MENATREGIEDDCNGELENLFCFDGLYRVPRPARR